MPSTGTDQEVTAADQLVAPLQLVEVSPASQSNIDRLFLLDGDFVSECPSAIATSVPECLRPHDNPAHRLRVFHFNDLHNHLTDLSVNSTPTSRFSQMASRVKVAREFADQDEAVLFLSAGDDHTGSSFDELLGWTEAEFIADAGYRVYSAAGLDCTVLGNHEFDRGTALLAQGIRQDARFPVLSANVHSSAHLKRGQDYHAAAIAVVNGLRIAMIGLTTAIETRVGLAGDPTFAVASPLTVLQNILPAIDPLADVILVLSHCGYGDGEHKSGKASAERDIGEADFSIARLICESSTKPAVVIGAHTHTVLNRTAIECANLQGRVPILQAGCNGQFLGELVVDHLPANEVQMKACLHKIENDHTETEFDQTHIAPLIENLSGILRNPIARVETDKLSFAEAATQRYAGGCDLLEFMADAICERAKLAGQNCDVALINGASILAGIERGNLTLGQWFDVMPYPDELMIISMSTVQLEAILASNSRRILRPEEVAHTDTSGFLPRGFLHNSHQLRYRLALGQSAAEATVHEITLNQQPLDALAGRSIHVGVPAYLALGGFGERWNGRPITGGVPGNLPGYDLRMLARTGTNLIFRNEIAEYLKSLETLDGFLAHLDDHRLSVTQPRRNIA